MQIEDNLLRDYKQAIKDKDTVKRDTIQLMRSVLLTAIKENPIGLTTIQVEDLFMKEKKKRYDALVQFEKANRIDLIQQAQKEITIISKYLPEPLTEFELEEEVRNIINTQNLSKKDIGTIMKQMKAKFSSRLNSRMLITIVNKVLEE